MAILCGPTDFSAGKKKWHSHGSIADDTSEIFATLTLNVGASRTIGGHRSRTDAQC